MEEKVFSFIEEHRMIEKGEKILLGVSGGADSMCLFWLILKYIKERAAKIAVVHVNHGIRGEEAERDELFVRTICSKNNIPFICIKVDVPTLARAYRLSEEECGRNERYRIFKEQAERLGCSRIAVAHNKNDLAETVLFNLFRGTGLRGAAGIKPVRGSLIRPLLCVERCEIEAYMAKHGYEYCNDSTNAESTYIRNRIRNDILKSAVENINSEAIGNIFAFAKRAAGAEKYLASQAKMLYNQIVTVSEKNDKMLFVDIKGLLEGEALLSEEVIRGCIEYIAGRLKDIEAVHIEAVLELAGKQTGKKLSIPYGIVVRREYDSLCFFKPKENEEIGFEPIKITFSGKNKEKYEVEIPYFNKKLSLSLYKHHKNDIIPRCDCIKWFDYNKLTAACEGRELTLAVRPPKEADLLRIGREHGTKRIKDYFKDIKIPLEERGSYPLLACENQVLWAIGKRASEAYPVDEHTQMILIAEII